MNPQPLPDHPLRLLHLGDSYTIGEGVADNASWPGQFRKVLQSLGYRIEESRIIAQTGWTTADLLQALGEADPPPAWDLVTLCIGVNNQYQGRSIEEYHSELVQLIDIGRSLLSPSPGQICLLSIPDWSVTPFAKDRDRAAVQSDIDRFNHTAKQTALAQGLPFVDWTPLTRQFSSTKDAFGEDGLHPSSLQYTAWTRLLIEGFTQAGFPSL